MKYFRAFALLLALVADCQSSNIVGLYLDANARRIESSPELLQLADDIQELDTLIGELVSEYLGASGKGLDNLLDTSYTGIEGKQRITLNDYIIYRLGGNSDLDPQHSSLLRLLNIALSALDKKLKASSGGKVGVRTLLSVKVRNPRP